MEPSLEKYMEDSALLLRQTGTFVSQAAMDEAVHLCVKALEGNLPILVCGNGGSAADAMHIAGELVARFLKERRGLNCICLSSNPAMLTAWSNDYGYETVFSRQVEAHGFAGGVLIGISTSGNSPNVLKAVEKAKEMGLHIVGLTGNGGGKMASLCDVLLDVPCKHTPLIQQAHACLYHYMCEKIEELATKDE